MLAWKIKVMYPWVQQTYMTKVHPPPYTYVFDIISPKVLHMEYPF